MYFLYNSFGKERKVGIVFLTLAMKNKLQNFNTDFPCPFQNNNHCP